MKIVNCKFKILLPICLFVYSFICLFAPRAVAHAMSNSQYDLQMDTINPFNTKSAGTNFNLPGNGKANYVIRSAFPFKKSAAPFTFSLSPTTIDLGILTAANPITRTNTITVSTNATYAYTIFAFENHQLMDSDNMINIPDTTCDNGQCSDLASAAWESKLTYGFGYRCDNTQGSDCASGFETSTFFKDFANSNNNKNAQSVMSGANTKDSQVKLTYKVNVSGSQGAGIYSNSIFFIAAPKY